GSASVRVEDHRDRTSVGGLSSSGSASATELVRPFGLGMTGAGLRANGSRGRPGEKPPPRSQPMRSTNQRQIFMSPTHQFTNLPIYQFFFISSLPSAPRVAFHSWFSHAS